MRARQRGGTVGASPASWATSLLANGVPELFHSTDHMLTAATAAVPISLALSGRVIA